MIMNRHVMGYAGHTSDQVAQVNAFSHCSVVQFYEKWALGSYECLWETETAEGVIRDLNGHCGNGKIEGFEECDDELDKCCDMTTCTWTPGCCQGNQVFECVAVRNEGGTIKIYGPDENPNHKVSKEMLNGYVGYYGGCIDPDPSVSRVYKEMEVRHGYRAPFFLKHVEDYILSGSNTKRYAIDTGTHKGWNQYTTEELGKGWWIISLNDDVSCAPNTVCHGLRAEVVCISDPDQPDILPNQCDWRAIPQTGNEQKKYGNNINNLDLSNWKLPTLTANKTADASVCYSDAHKVNLRACYECLHWESIPDGISIEGAPKHESKGTRYQNGQGEWIEAVRTVDLNGVYRRNGNEDCWHGMPHFVKDFLQIFYDSGEDKWSISYFGDGGEHLEFAKCYSDQFVGEYQSVLGCTEETWKTSKIHEDYLSWVSKDSMKVTQQWGPEVCLDVESWSPKKISIGGAPAPNARLNGDYSMSTGDENCLRGIPFYEKGALRITYRSDSRKWFVSDYGTEGDPDDLAECVSDKYIGGDIQDLVSCSRTKWKSVGDSAFNPETTMEVNPWDVCPGGGLNVDMISLVGSKSDALKRNFDGNLEKGVFDADQQCEAFNKLPYFKGCCRYNINWEWYGQYWALQVAKADANGDNIIWETIGKCVTTEQRELLGTSGGQAQDLRACTEGMWEMRKDQFKVPPTAAGDFHVVPTMTIQSSLPPISFNRKSQSLDNPANFEKWLECQPTMISGSIIIFYEETKFMAEDFGEFINQRRLAEASAECVAFMNVLFPGWPTNREDIPKDVDVECIGVDIAKNEATLKWKMSSRNEAALEKIERTAANVKGKKFAITISGKTVEVTVMATTRTGRTAHGGGNSAGWIADNWWVLLVIGLVVIISVVAVVFHLRCREGATAEGAEGSTRVWFHKSKGGKEETTEDEEEKAALKKGDKKDGKKPKKEEAKAKKGSEKKATAKGGKKVKGKKGAKK